MILMMLSLSFTLPIAVFVWALCYAAIVRRKTVRLPWRSIAWNMLAMWVIVAAIHWIMLPGGQDPANTTALTLAWVVAIVLCVGARWRMGRQAKAAATLTEKLPRLKG